MALTSVGGKGASGSRVPGGQAAADSHKWYLDRGGRNRRGACPCLPETGSALITSAATFHHSGLPRMWRPTCSPRIPSHTREKSRLRCLPSTFESCALVPGVRGRLHQQEKMRAAENYQLCFDYSWGKKNSLGTQVG